MRTFNRVLDHLEEWLVAVHRVGAKGRVIALDILDLKPIPGVEFLQLDFLDPSAPGHLKAMLGSGAYADGNQNHPVFRQTGSGRLFVGAELPGLLRG